MGFWTSTASNVRRLRGLTREERALFLQSMVMLRVLAAALWLMGLGPVHRFLARLSGAPRIDAPDDRPARVRVIAWSVAAAARHGGVRANCLERSLLLWWLLRRHGAPAALRIGVRKDGDALQAHAWIELDGEVLAETVDVRAGFAPFSRAIAPAAVPPR